MSDNRLGLAYKKSAFMFSMIFSLTLVLVAIISKVENSAINPNDVVIMFAMYFLLSVITGFRFFIDGSKWSLRLPFFVRNLIVAPVYFVVTFASVMSLSGMKMEDKSFVVIIVAVFCVGFLISNLIRYAIDKSGSDKMNDALTRFLEEHPYGEEE